MKATTKCAASLSAALLATLVPFVAIAQDARFSDPGDLPAGSGSGVRSAKIYLPDMRFPLESGPAYANSQVYGTGGSHGAAGSQCAKENYSYPWRDNFCESRNWEMPLCPSGKGHQGQDIRPATCKAGLHWAVAADDGVISSVGKYSVTLQSPGGTLYRYLHLAMEDLSVSLLDRVRKGDRIGKVSNDFGGASTTIHLHFDVKDAIAVGGRTRTVYVPPYSSLVDSYKRLVPR